MFQNSAAESYYAVWDTNSTTSHCERCCRVFQAQPLYVNLDVCLRLCGAFCGSPVARTRRPLFSLC